MIRSYLQVGWPAPAYQGTRCNPCLTLTHSADCLQETAASFHGKPARIFKAHQGELATGAMGRRRTGTESVLPTPHHSFPLP